jgi:hypothetical protein
VIIEILGVPAIGVARIWPRVVDLIEAAVAEGPRDYEADDYLEACVDARMQLWLISRDGEIAGAAVTHVHTFPRRKVVWVELLAGEDADEWLPALDRELCAARDAIGAEEVRGGWRKGWVRKLAKLGYRPFGHPMHKELAA